VSGKSSALLQLRYAAAGQVRKPMEMSVKEGRDRRGDGRRLQVRLQPALVLLLITPILAVTQEMGARMGAVTGKGLAALIRERFSMKVTAFAMLAMLIANFGTTWRSSAAIAAAFGLAKVPAWADRHPRGRRRLAAHHPRQLPARTDGVPLPHGRLPFVHSLRHPRPPRLGAWPPGTQWSERTAQRHLAASP